MNSKSPSPETGVSASVNLPFQPRKRRPALSCVQCRRRKVKCDRNVPCIRCTQSKTVCLYEPDHIKTKSNINLMAASTAPEHMDTSLIIPNHSLTQPQAVALPTSTLYHSATISGQQISQNAASGNPTPHAPVGILTSESEPSVQELKDRVHQLETMVSKLVKSNHIQTSGTTAKVMEHCPKIRGGLEDSRYFGMGHCMNIKKQFGEIHSLKSARSSDNSVPKLIKKCKDIARVVKSQRPTSFCPLPDIRSQIPSREASDLLVQHYFTTFESTFRILHRHTFYKEYEQHWENPLNSKTPFVIKLILVLAIGSLFSSEGTNRSSVSQWLYSAETWLNLPRERAKLTLVGVEVQCLLFLGRQAHSIGDNLQWIAAGSLIRSAMSAGLHRDPSHFPKMTILYAECRRRLWSTVLEISIQSSLNCAMPPLVSFDDFDCEPPSNYNDSEIDEQTKVYPPKKADSIYTDTSLQIALRSSLRSRLEICKVIHDFHRNPSYEDILSLGTELTSQIRSNVKLYQPSQGSDTLPLTTLDLLNRRFLLALHLPFAAQARTNPNFYFSRKVALDAATVLLSYPETSTFTRMRLHSGGYFREIISRSSMAVCLELISQINDDSSSLFLPSPSPGKITRKPLHNLVETIVALSKGRIEAGEANVKGFLFLSMAQAQALAMENGEDVKEAMLNAAKRASEEAYEVLKKQLVSTPTGGSTPVSTSGIGNIMSEVEGLDWNLDTSMDFDISNTWLFDTWGDPMGPI